MTLSTIAGVITTQIVISIFGDYFYYTSYLETSLWAFIISIINSLFIGVTYFRRDNKNENKNDMSDILDS